LKKLADFHINYAREVGMSEAKREKYLDDILDLINIIVEKLKKK